MPADTFFLDSSYIIALAHSNDQHHKKALELAGTVQQSNIKLVTTRAVLLEIGSVLCKNKTGAARFSLSTLSRHLLR